MTPELEPRMRKGGELPLHNQLKIEHIIFCLIFHPEPITQMQKKAIIFGPFISRIQLQQRYFSVPANVFEKNFVVDYYFSEEYYIKMSRKDLFLS